jgi:hypothetical protein
MKRKIIEDINLNKIIKIEEDYDNFEKELKKEIFQMKIFNKNNFQIREEFSNKTKLNILKKYLNLNSFINTITIINNTYEKIDLISFLNDLNFIKIFQIDFINLSKQVNGNNYYYIKKLIEELKNIEEIHLPEFRFSLYERGVDINFNNVSKKLKFINFMLYKDDLKYFLPLSNQLESIRLCSDIEDISELKNYNNLKKIQFGNISHKTIEKNLIYLNNKIEDISTISIDPYFKNYNIFEKFNLKVLDLNICVTKINEFISIVNNKSCFKQLESLSLKLKSISKNSYEINFNIFKKINNLTSLKVNGYLKPIFDNEFNIDIDNNNNNNLKSLNLEILNSQYFNLNNLYLNNNIQDLKLLYFVFNNMDLRFLMLYNYNVCLGTIPVIYENMESKVNSFNLRNALIRRISKFFYRFQNYYDVNLYYIYNYD